MADVKVNGQIYEGVTSVKLALSDDSGYETYTAGSGVSDENASKLVDKTITEFSSTDITKIGDYAFYKCSTLQTANCPNVTTIGTNCFSGCTSLTDVTLGGITKLASNAFNGCTALKTAHFPTVNQWTDANAFTGCTALTSVIFEKLNQVTKGTFSGCTALETADFGAVTEIQQSAFDKCTSLSALIIRTSSVCNLQNTSAISTSSIASGTGYIYVPSSLVDSYKAASNWSTYSTQFRAIEDYPDICG